MDAPDCAQTTAEIIEVMNFFYPDNYNGCFTHDTIHFGRRQMFFIDLPRPIRSSNFRLSCSICWGQ